MSAKLFGTLALLMLPTAAFAIDAGKTGTKTNETTPTNQSDNVKPDNSKAAGTGGGKGAAEGNSATEDRGTGKVGAQGAAATSQGAPGNENKPAATEAAGDGGGAGAKVKPEKTP